MDCKAPVQSVSPSHLSNSVGKWGKESSIISKFSLRNRNPAKLLNNISNISLHIFLCIDIFFNFFKLFSAEFLIIPLTSARMRSTFLLILGLCSGSFQQLLLPYPPDVCYEKDEVPVDVDVLYDDDCVDLDGNKYKLDSELYSCCDCFRL